MSEMSGYRIMWVITFFDLPVKSAAQRRHASEFRRELLQRGFHMAQLSVYFKYCHDRAQADIVIRDVTKLVPDDGRVDMLLITDKQYAAVTTIRGNERVQRENPSQLALF